MVIEKTLRLGIIHSKGVRGGRTKGDERRNICKRRGGAFQGKDRSKRGRR